MADNTISIFPNTSSRAKQGQADRRLAWLSDVERALLNELLSAYRVFRRSKRDRIETIEGDEGTLKDFLDHAHGLPGQIGPEHFERWGDSLYQERQVVASTQRRYQATVRVFFDYLQREPRHRLRIRQALGCELVQVATPENSIVHRRDRELERHQPRRSFTHHETARLLQQIDLEIRLAHQQCSKALASLQRNKALVCITLELGLRADEVLGLNLDSFEANPRHPQLGGYGLVRVYGKGGVWRQVPVLQPVTSELLQWYLAVVRPRFELKARAGEKALFLSERGTRLAYSTFHRAYTLLRDLAGLPRELVPHCLRHTSVSNNAMDGLSAEGTRIRHGHVFQSTTQGYTHFPDTFVQKDVSRLIRRNLDASK